MTDAFDKAMQDIAIRGAKNGGPTTADILVALQATNEDLDVQLTEQHRQTAEWHKEVLDKLDQHIIESGVRDRRLDEVESWQRHNTETCSRSIIEAVQPLLDKQDEDHLTFHNNHLERDHAPRREGDPDDADYRERRLAAAHERGDIDATGPTPMMTLVIVVIILCALSVAATLEYLDKENAAARILLILMPIVTLGGWWVASRRR